MKIIFTLVILISVLFLVTTCCDDCPSCPEPESEEHLFYIAPQRGNSVKVFSVERKAFIDSFTIDNVGENEIMLIHVIGDDSLLAASAGSSRNTYIVDLKTKEVIEAFGSLAITFSRDSRFYFHYNSIDPNNRRHELYLYPENEIIFTDPYCHGFYKFSNRSEIATFRHYAPGDPAELGFYNILGGTFTHSIKTWHGYEASIVASQAVDGLRKIFVDTDIPNGLAVCDFGSDTLRSLKSYPDAYTTLVVSTDEKYIFFTYWGAIDYGYVPTGHVYVWDAMTEDSVAAIPFTGFEQFDFLILTYDNRYLLAAPFNESGDYTTFCLIDAEKFEVIGSYDCGFLIGDVTAKYCVRDTYGL